MVSRPKYSKYCIKFYKKLLEAIAFLICMWHKAQSWHTVITEGISMQIFLDYSMSMNWLISISVPYGFSNVTNYSVYSDSWVTNFYISLLALITIFLIQYNIHVIYVIFYVHFYQTAWISFISVILISSIILW